jgi:hypothetical protein
MTELQGWVQLKIQNFFIYFLSFRWWQCFWQVKLESYSVRLMVFQVIMVSVRVHILEARKGRPPLMRTCLQSHQQYDGDGGKENYTGSAFRHLL